MNADRTVPTDDGRTARYADALSDAEATSVTPTFAELARAVMAVADAEQAELRAEIQRLEAVADQSASLAESLAERLRAAWERAEAAEAKVARVETLIDEREGLTGYLRRRSPGKSRSDAMDRREANALDVVIDRLRAAMADATEPEATDFERGWGIVRNEAVDEQFSADISEIRKAERAAAENAHHIIGSGAALTEPEASDATVYASVPHDREIHTPDALEWPPKEEQ